MNFPNWRKILHTKLWNEICTWHLGIIWSTIMPIKLWLCYWLPSLTNMHCPHGLLWLLQRSAWDDWDWVSEELQHSGHGLCKYSVAHTHSQKLTLAYMHWLCLTHSLSPPPLGWIQISTGCTSGCMCPDGLVSDGTGGCINETSCPCLHNGKVYQPGQTLTVGCNTWFVQCFITHIRTWMEIYTLNIFLTEV